MTKETLRIVYMGTPEFAVEPLKALVGNGFQVVGVVTMPDKPSGRGMKLQASPVRQYALEHHLPVLQPEKLKDPLFLEELRQLKADLQIVVAFRMLPEVVWSMPKMGTFNLHASLLPHYRGAAPIHWAVINGEQETGVTTFFLQQAIDTGDILLQEKLPIEPNECTGSVHDRLMILGARLVVSTVEALLDGSVKARPQHLSAANQHDLKLAPKLFKDNTRIDWSRDGSSLYNFIRGLSPFPTAWSELLPVKKSDGAEAIGVKIFEADFEPAQHQLVPGSVVSDGKKTLKVSVGNGFISLEKFQLAGRRLLTREEFLRGFQGISGYRFV